MAKQLACLKTREDRESFFKRVHRFVLPYHEGAFLIALAYRAAKEAFEKVERKAGGRYFEHCRAVAIILMDILGITDPKVIAAALLHDIVEDCKRKGWTHERVLSVFGPEVAMFVRAMTIPEGEFASRELRIAAYHDQLFAAMKTDVRVILIKLADRYHNLSTCESLSRYAQERMVEETETIYLPVAKEQGCLYEELTQVLAGVKKRLAHKPRQRIV